MGLSKKQNGGAEKTKKLDLLTIEKSYSFSVLFFSVFLFHIFFFISYSLFFFFLGERRKKDKKSNEKEEGFSSWSSDFPL